MSFSDTVFLFFLALILFGPKKLPEMARQAGKLLAELRRASNEFRSQIETEISHLEVEKTQTVLPPSPPPPRQLESANSLDTSTVLAEPHLVPPADPDPIASLNSTPSGDAEVESGVSTVQEPHV